MVRGSAPSGSSRRRVVVALLSALVIFLPAPAAAFAADAPNTCAGATTNSAQNAWIKEAIASATDVDWYRFSTATAGRVLITLGALPENYRLDLYGACGTLVASSNQSGRKFEQLYRYLAAGTYRAKVSSASGASSATPYALKFRLLPEAVLVLSWSAWIDATGYLNVAGEVLNNTGADRASIQVTARLYDAGNGLLKTVTRSPLLEVVRARQHSPFRIRTAVPAGYDHARVSNSQSTTAAGPIGDLSVIPYTPSTDGAGVRHYPGQVRNGNSFWVKWTRAVLTVYGPLGTVINAGSAATSPARIDPGGQASFEIRLSGHVSGENRRAWAARALLETGCDPAYPTVGPGARPAI